MRVKIVYKEYGAAEGWRAEEWQVTDIKANSSTIAFRFASGDFGALDQAQIQELVITE